MNKKIFLLAIFTLLLPWCSLIPDNNEPVQEKNPASIFCEENWWILEIVPDAWWERWKCNFEDGSFCEERAYYRWECSPNRWNWNTIELEDIQEIQNYEGISQDIKDEVSELVEEIQEYEDVEDSENNGGVEITCTADVKECADWTYVSRVWENCEFAACQWEIPDEDTIKEKLKSYETTWSWLDESDIDLMNEIIDTVIWN